MELPEGFVRDAVTKDIRCDYCVHWSSLSPARVMGWCERLTPRPIATPAWKILLANVEGDQTTAYNQVCAAYRPTEGQHP